MRKPLRSFGTVLRRFVALVPVLIAVTTLPIALLALLNAGVVTALEILVTGWLLLTPVAVLLAWIVLDLSPVDLPGSLADRGIDLPAIATSSGSRATPGLGSGSGSDADGDDAVAVLRERFARGEIDQAEFERRLDQLLESEGTTAGGRRGASARRGEPDRRDAPNRGSTRAEDGRTSDRSPPVRRDREPESS
ncbi:SHOCT domain-containing protein [Halosimplex aquaticum]|uniref:SHOCT domain-containing protein n=1 Tax=Halosimplex aquaticum TaxID=3026162 RepID=A0ABD5Y1J8_9EURY|nr:SHOCT domain-containing protein [Halosimplex aquaticum]